MTVSVLMPLKNQAPFVETTLRSLLAQEEEDFEVVIIDDGATDGSPDIVRRTVGGDPRFRLLAGDGSGILGALSIAADNATRRFVTRLDADDVMPARRLSLQKSRLEAAGPGHLVTGLVECFADGEPGPGYVRYVEWLNDVCRRRDFYGQRFKECVVASSNWMLHREDFEAAGGYRAGRYPEDYDLLLRLTGRRIGILPVDEVTLRWRDHPGRASRTGAAYADQKFYDLKVDHLLEQEAFTRLALWGAGPSGKGLARVLRDRGVDFLWVASNPNKIGQVIDGVRVDAPEILAGTAALVLVAVTQRGAVGEILGRLGGWERRWFEV